MNAMRFKRFLGLIPIDFQNFPAVPSEIFFLQKLPNSDPNKHAGPNKRGGILTKT